MENALSFVRGTRADARYGRQEQVLKAVGPSGHSADGHLRTGGILVQGHHGREGIYPGFLSRPGMPQHQDITLHTVDGRAVPGLQGGHAHLFLRREGTDDNDMRRDPDRVLLRAGERARCKGPVQIALRPVPGILRICGCRLYPLHDRAYHVGCRRDPSGGPAQEKRQEKGFPFHGLFKGTVQKEDRDGLQ